MPNLTLRVPEAKVGFRGKISVPDPIKILSTNVRLFSTLLGFVHLLVNYRRTMISQV